MARITLSVDGNTPFEKLIGHNKRILEKWRTLEEAFFKSSTFTFELKEQVRRTLAFNNGCKYCMSKGLPSKIITDLKIIAATKTADYISKNQVVDEFHFSLLKEQFSDSEISELLAFICFITASQKFGALLDLQPSCTL